MHFNAQFEVSISTSVIIMDIFTEYGHRKLLLLNSEGVSKKEKSINNNNVVHNNSKRA